MCIRMVIKYKILNFIQLELGTVLFDNLWSSFDLWILHAFKNIKL